MKVKELIGFEINKLNYFKNKSQTSVWLDEKPFHLEVVAVLFFSLDNDNIALINYSVMIFCFSFLAFSIFDLLLHFFFSAIVEA